MRLLQRLFAGRRIAFLDAIIALQRQKISDLKDQVERLESWNRSVKKAFGHGAGNGWVREYVGKRDQQVYFIWRTLDPTQLLYEVFTQNAAGGERVSEFFFRIPSSPTTFYQLMDIRHFDGQRSVNQGIGSFILLDALPLLRSAGVPGIQAPLESPHSQEHGSRMRGFYSKFGFQVLQNSQGAYIELGLGDGVHGKNSKANG